MPILENAILGKHTNATVVQFGNGDICVAQAKNPDNSHLVLFRQWEPMEIGQVSEAGKCNIAEIPEGFPIALHFCNPKSVAVLIGVLADILTRWPVVLQEEAVK